MGSKKREFCLEDLTILKSRKKGPIKYLPEDFFREHDKVARALLQSLEDNDAGAFLEILDAYLKVNRTKIARESCLSWSTVKVTFNIPHQGRSNVVEIS